MLTINETPISKLQSIRNDASNLRETLSIRLDGEPDRALRDAFKKIIQYLSILWRAVDSELFKSEYPADLEANQSILACALDSQKKFPKDPTWAEMAKGAESRIRELTQRFDNIDLENAEAFSELDSAPKSSIDWSMTFIGIAIDDPLRPPVFASFKKRIIAPNIAGDKPREFLAYSADWWKSVRKELGNKHVKYEHFKKFAEGCNEHGFIPTADFLPGRVYEPIKKYNGMFPEKRVNAFGKFIETFHPDKRKDVISVTDRRDLPIILEDGWCEFRKWLHYNLEQQRQKSDMRP